VDPSQRPPAGHQELLRFDETVVGESELGIETSKTVRALTKASRACLLYDFDNQAVADFLHEFDLRMERVLAHGPLRLEVRPWELVRDGETVYRDANREKSLSFRLYYDGVRALTFHPDVTWDELTRLVGILSIRYLGIRQQEDDVVTLLWKANFRHIDFETVEQYVPVDDEVVGADASSSPHARRVQLYNAEHEFGLPWPELIADLDIAYRTVPAEQLQVLVHEDGRSALPQLCQRLVEMLVDRLDDGSDALPVDLCIPLIEDIREFLLSEDQHHSLLEIVRAVHGAAQRLPDSAGRSALLAVFTNRDAFASMVDTAIGNEQAPDALVEIVSVAPLDQLEVLLQVLVSRWSAGGRDLGRHILARAFGGRVRQIGDLVLSTAGSVSADLLELVAELDQEFAAPLAVAMLRRNDRPSRIKALDVLEDLPYRSEVGRVLTETGLTSSDPEVRARAAGLLATNGEKRAVPAIAKALQAGADTEVPGPQLAPIAIALARLDPAGAVDRFRDWVRAGARRQRGRDASDPILHAVVDGLAAIPGGDAARLLRTIQSRADSGFKKQCDRAIALQKELSRRV
jgi:hypothetical protein